MRSKNTWNNRVLIVDDLEDQHQNFIDMLNPLSPSASTEDLAKAFGSHIDVSFLPEFELLHAESGEEAYNVIKESMEAGNPIAVAYMDIRMTPGWDGVETTHKIREIDRNIEIVIMTAHTEQPLSDIISGMESLPKVLYLEKPLEPDEVRAMTISLMEKWNIERQLEEKNQELGAVLDSTGDAIAMFDTEGRLVFANRWFAKMFGLTPEQMQEMSPDELRREMMQYFQYPNQFDEAEKRFQENPQEPVEESIELRIPERKVLHQTITQVRDADENNIGHLIVYRDAASEIVIARMERELLDLRAGLIKEYSFDNIIGGSKKMQDMYALMQQAIQSDITVLVRGESGTGKELVAKSIHYNSSRSNAPFIAVNCAAIPETLIESELFGHERGSFTGASARRIGKFEQANGGTVLLDEIGEMTPALQARLLRVLQEREIQRIGGTVTVPINVRVIASTNRDLEAAMEAGDFREDLYYRIAAFPIAIAPLRERREDIPLLADHFLNHARKRNGKEVTIIPNETLQILMNYDWPGNVRELENVIERAILLERSRVLQPESLPPEIQATSRKFEVISSKGKETKLAEILPLEEMEKQAIVRALKATGNNIRQTARILGINRATVYRKLEKFNLSARG